MTSKNILQNKKSTEAKSKVESVSRSQSDIDIFEKERVEAPNVYYLIKAQTLTDKLLKHGLTQDDMLEIFTELKLYEKISQLFKPQPASETETTEEHQIKPEFEENIVQALFWLPLEEQYQYFRVKIAESTIKAAGMGVYAVDDIPKGARGSYCGVAKTENDTNMYYAWTVKSFDPLTGVADEVDSNLYYIDASDLKKSNWTRYVNCGLKKSDNNFYIVQRFDKFFYVAGRDISAGEELFIDYGPEYRKDNLKMRGKY